MLQAHLTSHPPYPPACPVLKAHMLFGGARGDEYLAMFHDSYHAAIRHLKHGSWYIDAHMDNAQARLLLVLTTLEAALQPAVPMAVGCGPWL